MRMLKEVLYMCAFAYRAARQLSGKDWRHAFAVILCNDRLVIVKVGSVGWWYNCCWKVRKMGGDFVRGEVTVGHCERVMEEGGGRVMVVFLSVEGKCSSLSLDKWRHHDGWTHCFVLGLTCLFAQGTIAFISRCTIFLPATTNQDRRVA